MPLAELIGARHFQQSGFPLSLNLPTILGPAGEVILGLRMHANIAALAMGVPTFAIAYSRKTLGIMRMLGQERWVSDIDTLSSEALIANIEALWSERERCAAT